MSQAGGGRSFFTAEPAPVLFKWLRDRIQIPWTSDTWCFGRVVDGELAGVVAYQDDSGAACWIHIALEHPRVLTKTFLREIFAYPFEHRKLTWLLLKVPGCNAAAIEIYSRIGFRTLATIPDGHPDGDLIFMGARKEDVEWVLRIPTRPT